MIATSLLRTLAGESRYQQGMQMLQQHQVRKFQFENRMASAEVEGYLPKVRYLGERVEGSCNCAESEGFEFCQHCVSVVLFANELARQRRSLYKGPDKSKVMAYLLSLDKKELARQCLELIEQDPALMKRYLLRISLGGDEVDFKKLRSQITELTRNESSLFSQRQVQHFFSRIERFLEELSAADYLAQAESMSKVIEYAIRRINLVLDRVRSRHSGHETSAALLRHLYRHLLAALPSSSAAKATQLLKIWLEDYHGLLEPLSELLEEQPAVADSFEQKLLKAWQELPAAAEPALRTRLAAALLAIQPKGSRPELLQAWRVALAQSPEDWLRIAQDYVQQDMPEQARQILLAQLQRHPQHSALQQALITLQQKHPQELESIFELFCQHPQDTFEMLLTLSEHLSPTSRIDLLQDCEIFLAEQNQAASANLRARLLLQLMALAPQQKNHWRQRLLNLAQQHPLQAEWIFQLVPLTLDLNTDTSLALFCATLRQLLELERRKQDERAAEALFKLEKQLNAAQQEALNRALEPLRFEAQRRPHFLQHYRELQRQACR